VKIPNFAPDRVETDAYTLAEVKAMLKVLPEPSRTAVAVAAYSGLRLGEIKGLEWEAYKPTQDAKSLGTLHIVQSIWHGKVGKPKTDASK